MSHPRRAMLAGEDEAGYSATSRLMRSAYSPVALSARCFALECPWYLQMLQFERLYRWGFYLKRPAKIWRAMRCANLFHVRRVISI